ncbi:MAG: Ig-like domain-containing protein, partial [Pseudomonadota bacterium]
MLPFDGSAIDDLDDVRVLPQSAGSPPVAGDDVAEISGTSGSITVAEIHANDSDADGDGIAITGFSQPSDGDLELASANTFTYTQTSGYGTGNFQDTANLTIRELDSSYLFALPLITSTQELVNNIDPLSGSATLSDNGEGASFSTFANGLDYGAFDFPDSFLIEIEAYATNVTDNDYDLIFSIGAAADTGSLTLYIDKLSNNKSYIIAHMGDNGTLPENKGDITNPGHPLMFFEIDSGFEDSW